MWTPSTAGSTAPLPSKKTALGVRAKPLAPRRRRRLCYFESGRRSAARLLTKDEARRIAVDAGCLVAIVFSVGSVLLLGGLVSYGGNLFGASGAAIGIGAVLFVLASIAKERIDH